jgi:hypothetical protein
VVLRTVWEENIEWNLFSVQFLIRQFLIRPTHVMRSENISLTIVCTLIMSLDLLLLARFLSNGGLAINSLISLELDLDLARFTVSVFSAAFAFRASKVVRGCNRQYPKLVVRHH